MCDAMAEKGISTECLKIGTLGFSYGCGEMLGIKHENICRMRTWRCLI